MILFLKEEYLRIFKLFENPTVGRERLGQFQERLLTARNVSTYLKMGPFVFHIITVR